MPDYEIRLWDANSFDFDSVPFVKQAFEQKKWAFVSDYIRLYALYTEGGIYLDSDVKTYRRFDAFLNNELFFGTEPLPDEKVEIESAIMGAVKGHKVLKECLGVYENMDFSYMKTPTSPEIVTEVLRKYGYVPENRNQSLQDGVQVYDMSYFGHLWGTKPGNYYAIHFYTAAWRPNRHGWLYNYCKRNDIMNFYICLEEMLKKFRRGG